MPTVSHVVEPAHERAHDVSARLGRKQRLRGSEAQRHVHPDAGLAEGRGCLNAVARERALHHHVLVYGGELAALLYHFAGLGGDYLGADVAIHYVADHPDLLRQRAAFPGYERGIGGDAIDDSPACALVSVHPSWPCPERASRFHSLRITHSVTPAACAYSRTSEAADSPRRRRDAEHARRMNDLRTQFFDLILLSCSSPRFLGVSASPR